MYTLEDQRELHEMVATLDKCYVESADFYEGANLDSRAEYKALMKKIKTKNHEIKDAIKSKKYDVAHKGIKEAQKLLEDGYNDIKELEGGVGSAVLGYLVYGFTMPIKDFLICFIPIFGSIFESVKTCIQQISQISERIKKDDDITPDTFNMYRNRILSIIRDLQKNYDLLDKRVKMMEKNDVNESVDEIDEASVGTMLPVSEPTGIMRKASPLAVDDEFDALRISSGEEDYTESIEDIGAKITNFKFIAKEKKTNGPETKESLKKITSVLNAVDKYMVEKDKNFVPFKDMKREVKALKKDDPRVSKVFEFHDVEDGDKLALVALKDGKDIAFLSAVHIKKNGEEWERAYHAEAKYNKYYSYYTVSISARYFKSVGIYDLKQTEKWTKAMEDEKPLNLEYVNEDILHDYGIDSILFEDSMIEDRVEFDFTEDVEEEFTEAAKIDDDIKDIIDKLNEKGYETKYSCSGHPSARLKSDQKRDGIKYGNLYSTARIVFAEDYNFGSYPTGWEGKQLDNGALGIYVKGPKFRIINGLPTDQFYAWKKKYMYHLEKWVDALPNKEDLGDPSSDEEVTESLHEIFQDLLVDLS